MDLTNSLQEGAFLRSDDDGFHFKIGDAEALIEADEFVGVELEPGATRQLLVEFEQGGAWVASMRKAEKLATWQKVEAWAADQAVVEGLIVGRNRGGLAVSLGAEGLRAFLPKSQLETFRVNDFEPYLGRRFDFAVTEFDPEHCNIVVSRRILLEKERGETGNLEDRLAPGAIFEGTVRNLKKYGAFIDIGGMDGLLHVSNMSWGRIKHPKEMLSPGDTIRVVVLSYDPDSKRLSLGHKQLDGDPWTSEVEDLEEGQVITGKVSNLADFGAFVEIRPGLEGLVHVTEISWTEQIDHPKDALDVGQKVEVKIISIDAPRRRVGLSLKALEKNPYEQLAEKLSLGDRVSGPIKTVKEFGLFVEVAPGIDGLVHVSDLSWTERYEQPPEEFEVGKVIEAVILELDTEAGRVGLGIKQLSDDPWALAEQVAKVGEKIEVRVSRLVDYGAFAEVVKGVEGLIHISELSTERVESVAAVVREGQSVRALVTSFDRGNQRIGLSLKRDSVEEEGGAAREYTDEGAGGTLGDIFRNRLGLGEEEGE
jgi:small subunit ribosomal protein S1